MAELPPIIERLDALKLHDTIRDAAGRSTSFRVELIASYPDLRAELLRLQAERDEARLDLEHEKNWSSALEQERDDVLWANRHYISEFTRIQNERDALLEALKEMTHRAEVLQRDLRDAQMPVLAGIAERMVEEVGRPAISSVEGKDG